MKSRAFKPGLVQTGIGLLMTMEDRDKLHDLGSTGDKTCLYYTIEDLNGKRHSVAECKGSAKVLKMVSEHFGVLTFAPHRKCRVNGPEKKDLDQTMEGAQ